MEKYRETLTLEELALVEMHRTCKRVGVEPPMDEFRQECFERIMRCNNGDRVAVSGLLGLGGVINGNEISLDLVKIWRLHNMWKTSCCPYMWAMDNHATEATVRAWGYEILPEGFFPAEILDVVDV